MPGTFSTLAAPLAATDWLPAIGLIAYLLFFDGIDRPLRIISQPLLFSLNTLSDPRPQLFKLVKVKNTRRELGHLQSKVIDA